LLDEPLGALDLKLRRQMQDELKAIQKRIGTTFVHVTHDQEEAMAIADRIVVMNQGKIEDFGPPSEIYMRPRSLFAAGFMGEVNFVPGKIRDIDGTGAVVETALGKVTLPKACFTAGSPSTGQGTMLCIRPEHFRRAGEGDGAVTALGQATVSNSAFFGTHYRCHLAPNGAPDTNIVAHMPQSTVVAEGQVLTLAVNVGDIVALPSKQA
jgi:spermidine/putrescine transport system ATP-binding protein